MNDTKMIKTFCQAGDHWYERESKCGRPPLHCPEHKPVDQPRAILRPKVEYPKTETVSILDSIPGLKQALTMETLFCEIGQHEWERESKRGRKPPNCPEHASTGAIVRKVEKAQENKQKVREGLETAIAGLSARVAAATEIDDAAYLKLRQNPSDEGSFKHWLRVNSRLLNEVTALRTNERNLEAV